MKLPTLDGLEKTQSVFHLCTRHMQREMHEDQRRVKVTFLILPFLFLPSAAAKDPIPLASVNGVTMYSVTQDSPRDDALSAKIVLKTDDKSAMIVGFEDIKIEGDVIQLWSSLGGPNVLGPQNSAIYGSNWAMLDTHLLITDAMIVSNEYSTTETNDGSLGIGSCPPNISCIALPVMGIGPTRLSSSTGVIRLGTDFQSDELDFAQVVTSGNATITAGVFGVGLGNPDESEGAFFDAVPVVFDTRPTRFCATSFARYCYDFDNYARLSSGSTLSGDGRFRGNGGYQETAYASVNDAGSGQRGVWVLPVDGDSSLVLAGRTSESTSSHDVDNIEIFDRDKREGRLKLSAYLRIGGGSDLPGEGFSLSLVPNTDLATAGDGNGFAGINGERNLPEEGSMTGISISFDERQTGPVSLHPDTRLSSDAVGITLRFDGEVIGQASLPTLHGALDDPTSLQTGPNTGDVADLGWAILTIDAPAADAKLPEEYDNAFLNDNFTVTWKGLVVDLFPVPEPSTSLPTLIAFFGMLALRRRRESSGSLRRTGT